MDDKLLELNTYLNSKVPAKPAFVHTHSDPTPLNSRWRTSIAGEEDASSEEYIDILNASQPSLDRSHEDLAERRESVISQGDMQAFSGSSSPRPSIPSSTTTPSVYSLNSFIAADPQQPSVLARLRSSISTKSTFSQIRPRPTVLPSDFQKTPQEPEKHFVDSIGMLLPGVCDRPQCTHPVAHFVSVFRLCEPIEYTTALADHGITFADYSLLVTALSNFLDETPKRRKSDAGLTDSENEDTPSGSVGQSSMSPLGSVKETKVDTTQQLRKARQHANTLNKFLEDITWNLQAKGIPVMICVNSFSLFSPHRISEAHIQILHVPLTQLPSENTTSPNTPTELSPVSSHTLDAFSFIDPFSLPGLEKRPPRPKLEREGTSSSSVSISHAKGHRSQHHHLPVRDRSVPSPLWPNAIPSRKRSIMKANAERYGLDPYFRAWMRANINARTRSSTYAKYMIEQEDDPFVNKRLDYIDSSPGGGLFLGVLVNGTQGLKEKISNRVNRERYEHNRRLECRKIVEHGSRLRIVRFGFTQPIYPPHTPEMDALGLTKEVYHAILSKIDDIHAAAQLRDKYSRSSPKSYFRASLNKIRRRTAEDALMEVSDYIRELNASQRRIVWTIERIPRVYDRGLAGDRTEWEISAWNGEDPLELLIRLERWGIIEKRLDVEEDD